LFFSDRNGKETLAFAKILLLLDKLPESNKYDFVISGGEPLLSWRLTKRLILYIKKKYPESEITLQTNMLFFSEERAVVLKENDVVVEPGIDGDFPVNSKHRKGMTEASFKKCLKNLESIAANNLRMNPTMTVHPEEVWNMFKSFKKLVSLGLNSIEVHPSFMTDWGREEAKEFIRQYIIILEYEKRTGRCLVCKDYSLYKKGLSLDLVIQPDGFVLPNWTYLAFPYKLRENFFIMKLSENGIIILEKNFIKYLSKLKGFFKETRTYRDFSNFNASLVFQYVRNAKLEKSFLNYKRLCKIIQNVDQLFLRRRVG